MDVASGELKEHGPANLEGKPALRLQQKLVDPRTSGRRARQRHSKTSRKRETRHNAAGGTQRCGLSRSHRAGGGMLPTTGLLAFTKAVIASQVSMSKSRTRRSSLDFAHGDSTVAACIINITPHRESHPGRRPHGEGHPALHLCTRLTKNQLETVAAFRTLL